MRRAYLFDIGSPAWQKANGQIINKRGVPIAVRVRTQKKDRRLPDGTVVRVSV